VRFQGLCTKSILKKVGYVRGRKGSVGLIWIIMESYVGHNGANSGKFDGWAGRTAIDSRTKYKITDVYFMLVFLVYTRVVAELRN